VDTQRVVEIIMEEARKVELRYPTYADDICEVVAEIVDIERKHRFATRNVKQDIGAQINTLGADLAVKLAGQSQ
jgi:hypothetical protein